LGGVEVREVESRDYEIWVANWGVEDERLVHGRFVVEISQRVEGKGTTTDLG